MIFAMDLRKVIALTALAVAIPTVFFPMSGLAVTQKVVRTYKTKAPKHDHLKVEKHTDGHNKQFASSVKEHGKRAKAFRLKTANDGFGVHKE